MEEKKYSTAECTANAVTPAVENAPRASLTGGPGQGNALSSAEEESASPAARPAARGRAVNQTELAQIIGVTDVTLWEWQKLDGFPILHRGANGQSNLYDTSAVIFWKINHDVKKASGPESQKDRLARLQADRIEIELAQLRGQSIPAELIEPAWIGIVNAVKQALLPLGLRLAPVLETTPGVDAKRELIDEEVHDALTKLSAYGDESAAGPGAQGDVVPRATEADIPEEMG